MTGETEEAILVQLRALHTEQVQLIDEHHRVNRERKRVHAELVHAGQRLAIVRGERRGGRPKAAYVVDSIQSRIQAAVESEPEREWTPQDVADAVGIPRPQVATMLSNLLGYHRVRRVRRGVYKAIAPGTAVEPAPEEQVRLRRGPLIERAFKVIDEDPGKVWNAKRLMTDGCANTINQARDVLTDLHARGKIKRVSHGHYAALTSTAVVKLLKTTVKAERANKRRRWNADWVSPTSTPRHRPR